MFEQTFLSYILVAIVSFVVGLLTGYTFRGFSDKSTEQKASYTVLYVVLFAWLLSFMVDIFNPNYTTSPVVHGMMGVIVGFFFKPEIKIGKKK